MTKFLKEPLLHFLLIGCALFALFQWVNAGDSVGEGESKIIVPAGRVEQLANIFVKTWQRPPTSAELKGIIDDFILEEVYYRKAVEMGIDQNDTMIRRRLRQKLEFITDDAAALVEPSDEELSNYLAENKEKFQSEPSYTLLQLYFNPEKHGDDPVAAIAKKADELRGGGEVLGDRTLLPEGLEDASAREIDGTFGTGFAEQFDALAIGEWSGPIRSGLGYHLVRLESRTPGKIPALEDVRLVVEREWAHEKRLELRSRFNEELLKDFEITVEWPKADSPNGKETEDK